jgi:hypothetical protein
MGVTTPTTKSRLSLLSCLISEVTPPVQMNTSRLNHHFLIHYLQNSKSLYILKIIFSFKTCQFVNHKFYTDWPDYEHWPLQHKFAFVFTSICINMKHSSKFSPPSKNNFMFSVQLQIKWKIRSLTNTTHNKNSTTMT